MNIGIVGAGVGGLSLARAIERMSLGRAVVLEQSPVLRPNLGGSLALSGGAVVLNKLGLGRELGLIQNPLLEIEQRSNGRLLALHDLEGIVSQSTYLGPTGKSLIGTYMRDDLQKTLVDSLAEGTLLLGRRLVALEIQSDKVLVKALNDGNSEEYVFDALIGADGIRSETRRLLWGEFSPSYTGFQVVYGVALRSTREHPHRVTQNYRPGALWMSASAGPADKRRDIMALAYRRPLKDAAAFGWLTGHQISDLHAAMDRFDAPDEVRAIAKVQRESFFVPLFDASLTVSPINNRVPKRLHLAICTTGRSTIRSLCVAGLGAEEFACSEMQHMPRVLSLDKEQIKRYWMHIRSLRSWNLVFLSVKLLWHLNELDTTRPQRSSRHLN